MKSPSRWRLLFTIGFATRLPLRAVALSRASAKIVVFGDRPETRVGVNLCPNPKAGNNKEMAMGSIYPVLVSLPSL